MTVFDKKNVFRKIYLLNFYIRLRRMNFLILFVFSIDDHFHGISDLSLLMALVKLNRHNKNSIAVAMRVLSALDRKERPDFPIYLKEVILWADTDEKVGDIVEHLRGSCKK